MSSNLTEGTPHRHKYQDTDTRSCRNWKTDRLEEPGVEGSNPSERTHRAPAGAPHGPEPHSDGREDVCKTSGKRFDSASGLAPRSLPNRSAEQLEHAVALMGHLRRLVDNLPGREFADIAIAPFAVEDGNGARWGLIDSGSIRRGTAKYDTGFCGLGAGLRRPLVRVRVRDRRERCVSC